MPNEHMSTHTQSFDVSFWCTIMQVRHSMLSCYKTTWFISIYSIYLPPSLILTEGRSKKSTLFIIVDTFILKCTLMTDDDDEETLKLCSKLERFFFCFDVLFCVTKKIILSFLSKLTFLYEDTETNQLFYLHA